METKAEYLVKENDFPQLLKALLKEGMVDKVIGAEVKVSRKSGEEDRFSISPVLWEKPEDIESFPLSNLIAYGFSRTDSASKFLREKADGARDEKIALVARPCDTRALIELSKIRQVNLENLFIIGLEDRGITLNVSRELRSEKDLDTSKIVKEKITDEGLLFLLEDGKTKQVDLTVADNCSRCVRKTPVIADISITDIGLPIDSEEVIIKVHNDQADDLIEKSGIEVQDLSNDIKKAHEEKMTEIIKAAEEKRTKDLKEWNELSQKEKLEQLKKCTMCGMCIRGCASGCYCLDCILQKKRKDKNIDNVTYQLTRIAHVADRCVECGKCANNCPMDLPLSLIFQSLNEQFEEQFKYKAGESEDDIPFRSGKAIREMELEKT